MCVCTYIHTQYGTARAQCVRERVSWYTGQRLSTVLRAFRCRSLYCALQYVLQCVFQCALQCALQCELQCELQCVLQCVAV